MPVELRRVHHHIEHGSGHDGRAHHPAHHHPAHHTSYYNDYQLGRMSGRNPKFFVRFKTLHLRGGQGDGLLRESGRRRVDQGVVPGELRRVHHHHLDSGSGHNDRIDHGPAHHHALHHRALSPMSGHRRPCGLDVQWLPVHLPSSPVLLLSSRPGQDSMPSHLRHLPSNAINDTTDNGLTNGPA